MPPVVEPAKIEGVYTIKLQVFGDARGNFRETFRASWIPGVRNMVQGNCSFSAAGVLRGLHYHMKQADLWNVVQGHARAVLWDARPSSPTFRTPLTVEMDAREPVALYIPKGVAHGFYSVTDVLLTYLVDEYYDNSDELGILWNDPELGCDWGAVSSPVLSNRDAANPRYADIPAAIRPR